MVWAWTMWGLSVFLSALTLIGVFGCLSSSWCGRVPCWVTVFAIVAWWQYIGLYSWTYWAELEREEQAGNRPRIGNPR
jgi:hypothetical protein